MFSTTANALVISCIRDDHLQRQNPNSIIIYDNRGAGFLDLSADRWVQIDEPDFTPTHKSPHCREL